MGAWTGADVLVGDGSTRQISDADRATEKALREKTLAGMGIVPLSAFSSSMMDTVPTAEPVKKSRVDPRYTPRKVARAAGDLYYFPLRPCVRGHTSKRFTASANCAACWDIYRMVNVDKVRKHSRDSHQRARDRAKIDAKRA